MKKSEVNLFDKLYARSLKKMRCMAPPHERVRLRGGIAGRNNDTLPTATPANAGIHGG